MNIELIISLFALAISFLTYIRYRVNLKFKLINKAYFLSAKEFPLFNYSCGNYLLVSIKISNSSAQAITIDEVYALAIDPKSDPHSHTHIDLSSFDIPISQGIWKHKVLSPSATLPIRIQSYDSVCFSFCFLSANNLKKPYKIIFTTPSRNYCFTLDPCSVEEISVRPHQ